MSILVMDGGGKSPTSHSEEEERKGKSLSRDTLSSGSDCRDLIAAQSL